MKTRFVLAFTVVLVTVGATKISAELVHIDPDDPFKTDGTLLDTAYANATLSTYTLPHATGSIAASVYARDCVDPPGSTHPADHWESAGQVFAWHYNTDNKDYAIWYNNRGTLRVLFNQPVSYVEVEYSGTTEGSDAEYANLGAYSGTSSNPYYSSPIAVREDRFNGGQSMRTMVIDLESAQIRQILLSGGIFYPANWQADPGSWPDPAGWLIAGESIFINRISYSVDPYDPEPPEPPIVPEPAGIVGIVIALSIWAGLRLRRK